MMIPQMTVIADLIRLPPPLVIATQKSQINMVPTPTVAWTRPQMLRFKKRRLRGELVPERERECACVHLFMEHRPWAERGGGAQISPKSELCGFKWANTHNKCVHDSVKLAFVTTPMSYVAAVHLVPN